MRKLMMVVALVVVMVPPQVRKTRFQGQNRLTRETSRISTRTPPGHSPTRLHAQGGGGPTLSGYHPLAVSLQQEQVAEG
jgi:hypothetical protein